MALIRLAVRNLRVVEAADLRLSPNFNLILGPNAAGKTSLLEAVYFLSSGRSFRSARSQDLVRRGCEEAVVQGELVDGSGGAIKLGIGRSARGIRAKLRGERAQAIAELAELLPVVAVYPEGQDLVSGPPGLRRSLVDWGLFHGDPGFREVRRRYMRALRQRNALLRTQGSDQALGAWDEEMGKTGAIIDEKRGEYVASLGRELEGFGRGVEAVLRYRPGWSGGRSYRECLERSRGRDRVAGFTQTGPHRADVLVEIEGAPAGRVASRGQQKVLVATIRMGQVALLARATGKRSVVLVDDLPSELDARRRVELMETMRALGAQLLVTAIERGGVPALEWDDQRMFHVEHGEVRELI